MSDLMAMMWKEGAELVGNRRFLWIFTIMVLTMGVLPALTFAQHHGQSTSDHSPVLVMVRVLYVLFATVVVVAQTAPDMVLHERVGHTLDYLLTTRLPGYAIVGAKVLVSAAMGYAAAMLVIIIQLIAASLIGGTGWQWLFLGVPAGRLVAFGTTAAVDLYVAVVGTLVALRVGEQRIAYLFSMLAVAVLIVPILLGWIHLTLTIQWIGSVTLIVAIVATVLLRLGLRLFRRDKLVLYLQE